MDNDKTIPIKVVCPVCITVCEGNQYKEFKSWKKFSKHMWYDHGWRTDKKIIEALRILKEQNPTRLKKHGQHY